MRNYINYIFSLILNKMGASGSRVYEDDDDLGEIENIIWIDLNVNSEENKEHIEELESYVYFNVKCFNNVEESIDFIKKIQFKETTIIVDGRLYIEFINKFKEDLKDICIIPKIVIFTKSKKEFLNNNKEYEEIINHPFFNFGGIKETKEEIKEFLIKNNRPNKIILNEEDDCQLVFEYIDVKEKLLLPILYKVLIKVDSYDDIEKFSKYLYKKYKEYPQIRNLLKSINLTKKIPLELLSKYYIKIYTNDSCYFYGHLNRDLRNNKRDKYLPYIKVLYEGIRLKALPFGSDNTLYRGTILADKEIKLIKNYLDKKIEGLPGAIIFSKIFLSFSKDRDTAEKFMKGNMKNFLQVLFILEKDENMDFSLSTHADVETLSYFSDEREVLFFPFSSFEIKEVNQTEINGEDAYEIKLKYLGKYLKLFENKPIEIPNSEFKKELINFGLIEKEDIDNKNEGQLLKEFIKFKNNMDNVNEENNEEDKSNCIIGEMEFDKDEEARIINSFEEVKRNNNKFIVTDESENTNENEIKNKLEIKINGEQINFSYFYKFSPGKYKIQYKFKSVMKRINCMFYECNHLKNIDLSNFDTEDITNISYIFYGCNELENINFTNFTTYNVTEMSHLFKGCFSLKKLDLSNFNTERVSDMKYMFYGCKSLKEINLSSFNTENVCSMRSMFDECNSLEKLDLSKFSTENVSVMDCMFFGCNSIKELDLSNFNTNNVTNMSGLFNGCNSLKSLNISSFNTENTTDMSCMFSMCMSLPNLDLSNFNTQKVTNMSRMFNYCQGLKDLDLSSFQTPNLTNISFMFSECNSLQRLDLSNFNSQNIKNTINCCEDCQSLTKEQLICNDSKINSLL